MATFDAAKDASATVSDVKKSDKSGKDAYAQLAQDTQKAESQDKMTPEQKTAYLAALNTQLSKAGLIPELSVEFGNDHFKSLSQGGSTLTKGSIEGATTNLSLNSDNNNDGLTQTLISQLEKTVGGSSVKQSDLQGDISTERAQAANRGTDASLLFQGSPPLIATLDNYGDTSKSPDGTIGSSDITAYLADAKKAGPNDPKFPAADVALVTQLSNGLKLQNGDGSTTTIGNGNSFSVSDLSKLLGTPDTSIKSAGDYGALVSAFNGSLSDKAGQANEYIDPASAKAVLATVNPSSDVTYDANGNATITSKQLAALMTADKGNTSETAALQAMAANYSDGSGGINLDAYTQATDKTYASSSTAYSDSLGASGKEPTAALTSAQKTALAKAGADPSSLAQYAGTDGQITQASLTAWIQSHPQSDTTVAQALSSTFDNVSTGGQILPGSVGALFPPSDTTPTTTTPTTPDATSTSAQLAKDATVASGGSYYSAAESIVGTKNGQAVTELVSALEAMNNNKSLNPNDTLFSSPQDLVNYLNGNSQYADALKSVESTYGVQAAAAS